KHSSERQKDNGQSVIKLDTETQRLSGIETITLKPVNYQAEFTANGKAINIQPLLALRNRYLIALTENTSAKARFKQAEQNISRQQDLYRHGASSKRSLQEQQAQWQANKAQVNATNYQNQAIIDEALLLWGKELTGWAMSSDSDKLGAFLSGRKRLLYIALPTNKHLDADIQTIYIEASGDRSKARKAELVSVAAKTEAVAQGESYYFQTDDKNIITGMNVTAWIPEQNVQLTGVIIPKSALIRYMGQAFVYLKTTQESFSRRIIDQYSATSEGYFIPDAINPGEQIVTTGGQMLLSEELRGQIPGEDDD
ncbi:MAG: efflux RND transporter periplasmic adaptor subunit, partial [Gammaproteobacteria bacterium]